MALNTYFPLNYSRTFDKYVGQLKKNKKKQNKKKRVVFECLFKIVKSLTQHGE